MHSTLNSHFPNKVQLVVYPFLLILHWSKTSALLWIVTIMSVAPSQLVMHIYVFVTLLSLIVYCTM